VAEPQCRFHDLGSLMRDRLNKNKMKGMNVRLHARDGHRQADARRARISQEDSTRFGAGRGRPINS